MSRTGGWLLAQLPQAMAGDPVIAGIVLACEEVAETLRDRASTVEYELDVDLASPEMLGYLATWLDVEAVGTLHGPADRDARRMIRAVGQVLGWRGTRRGVEVLIEALTGARAEVTDSGGIFGHGDPMPPPDDVVRVVLDHPGRMSERQILAFLGEELPVGARVELRIRSSGTGGSGVT